MKTNEPTAIRRAFGYLRVSSDGQKGEDRDGLKRQERTIMVYAKANGYTVAKWFSDEGVSGTIPHNARPAFKNLLGALYGDGITTVIVEDVDRLGRDAEITLDAIGDFRRAGFVLLTSKGQNLTSTTVDARLRTGMDSVIAEYIRGQLVDRLRSARMQARATRPGYREGRKPYGSLPGEREIVRRIVRLRETGLAYDSIAELLNAEEVPARITKAGRIGRWHPTTIARILARES